MRTLSGSLLLVAASCAVAGPPVFPEATTAMLAGPLCAAPGRPCTCAVSSADAGEPPPGMRRFEVRLPSTRGTASAVVVDGIGAFVRDERATGGSCFYFDARLGATHGVRYLARAGDVDRGITVALSMREVGPEGGWYDLLEQRCGTSDTPCRYESVRDWTAAISGGHRFHDSCGSARLMGMRVEGNVLERHLTDGELSFDMNLRHEGPLGSPGGRCREAILPPGVEGGGGGR